MTCLRNFKSVSAQPNLPAFWIKDANDRNGMVQRIQQVLEESEVPIPPITR